ncbi:outer membrane beta-barrel protein [Tenacibaculum jejuense]|uniref:Outer membrane protein beta-barrel domain-containing protein n=1 Tax=Tenacibaculum jejuense TaxID=584609 RepID=A0A238UB92_9FLAO|nr:outer membrane beta-barrel protein [Tenacibaculum jejuense]SNR15680.1 conserved exported protein of unknown function [Tenacibaculum jejuense]
MKKLLLTIAVIAFGFVAKAQDGQFNVGGYIGLPIGDAGDAYSFSYGAEVNYLFELSEEFQLGPSLSYQQYLGDTVAGFEIPSVAFLPIAAAARYSISEKFSVGADLGFALGIDEGNDGGFYYRPMVGYQVFDKVTLQLSYSGISVEGATVSNIGLGAVYSF